jgi:putative transposase
MYLPGIPAHVVQRGNNRAVCFFCDDDYLFYLELLRQGLNRFGVYLHAYVLMTNHVHLLMTPEQEDSISRLMQHLGRNYVLYINKYYRRTGTLWEGRHKASLVDADNYLLTSYRYIEMNPVAAGMVSTPDEYRWSSYRHHAFGTPNLLVIDHPIFDALGQAGDGRQHAYRDLFRSQLPDQDVHRMRECLDGNFPLGNDRFRQDVEAALNRRLGYVVRGRPRRTTNS